MAVRLKDIATELGISVVTVSKVLHNEGRISAKTRERVLNLAQKLNYRPNINARSLVTGRSFMIGMVVPDLLHPFFAAIAKMVSTKLRSRGYILVIASSEESVELECQAIESLLARSIDALVLVSNQTSAKNPIFKRIEEQRIPLLLVSRAIAGVKAHFIGFDDVLIGQMATEHLIDRGYRRIAHIRGPEVSTARDRLKGYLRALKAHGYQHRPSFVLQVESADESGEKCGFAAMQKLLAMQPRPDAVFSFNDIIAMGALKAAQEGGYRVPADVAIMGVSNLAAFSFWHKVNVPLTTVDQHISVVAERVSALLLQLVGSGIDSGFHRIHVQPELVVRDST